MNGGDLTRSTFKAHRHYSGVRMQQGRVQLDADWNEQLDVTAHRDRAEALDVIGAAGVPKQDGGFELTVSPDGQDLLLSPGRAWVGGRLCEVDAETTAVVDTPSSTSVTVASLVLDGTELVADGWVEVGSDTESVVARATSVDVATNTISLDTSISTLNGDLGLRRRASYSCQPDLPEPEHTSRASATDPRLLDLPEGSYLAYVDVWDRAITALDDPAIAEPAIGVDTATRSRIVWQVRLLDLAGVPDPVDCDSNLAPALEALAPGDGRMAARAEPPAGSVDLCRPTPAGGYIGLQNQLYRVHVHDLAGGRPVILWSRENASVGTTWTSTITSDILEVADIGKDAVLGFGPGDWVELYDDTCTLTSSPGTLVRLLNAKEDRLTLDLATATGSTDIAAFPRNPQVRRWDSPGAVTVADEDWLELELGVQVRFPADGSYRRHDYWLVPARSVLADVDWPADSGGEAVALLPAGVRHDIGRLAIVSRTSAGLGVQDCRDLFPSLTTLTASDVTVLNEACQMPGVETVQQAIDVLCRAHDLRRHNRLLHGYGIVNGLQVHCGDQEDTRRPERFSTTERRDIFRADDLDEVRARLGDRFDFDRIDLGDLRERAVRRSVTVAPGSAIDADGYDIDVTEPILVDVLAEAEALGELDAEGDGEVCLVLRSQDGQGPVVAATKYAAREDGEYLKGTLLLDIYNDCIDKPLSWVKAQLETGGDGDQDAYLLRSALTNLLTYVANPGSGGHVFVSEKEHVLLLKFYEGLKKRLRSETFCAMYDDARPYPDYPEALAGLRTISGSGMHSRARSHPGGNEVWTTGGGLNPLKPSTMINRYNLREERLVSRMDPVSGKTLERGDTPSSTAAAVTDVAFSPDGKQVYATVPTRDGNDTIFRVGNINDVGVDWLPATTICGVKLVSLATTDADPGFVYAVGLRRKSTERRKAVSLREFTGAGLFRIPVREVPEGLGPIEGTADLNTIGHLVISPGGDLVFTCGAVGGTAERYERLVWMNVREQRQFSEIPLEAPGTDDLALVLESANIDGTSVWTAVGSGSDRLILGHQLATGALHARVPVGGEGRLSLQAARDRIVVTDMNTSLTRVLDTATFEFRERIQIPVQVAPAAVTGLFGRTRNITVLNMVSNSLTVIDIRAVLGDEFDSSPLVAYRRAAVEAFVDLVGGLAQYLKDCICDHLLVKSPPPVENKDLDLAAVSIRGGSVYQVCNFSRRRYVKSFPTVGYWLSLVPFLPLMRELIGRACCALAPEYLAKYSTAGHDEAEDRIGATKLLSFLEVAQNEDPLTKLRSMDLGFLPKFLKGANEGDWGDDDDQRRAGAPITTEAEEIVVRPGVVVDGGGREDVARPSGIEIVLSNLLSNPVVRRDVVREYGADDVRERPAPDADRLESLLARVDALESELAALRKPAKKAATRKSTAKPKQ